MPDSLAAIAADVQVNWLLYLSMPFIAAAIGYGTKIVAIEMMFRPLEFRGLQARLFGLRLFGWQGIVPRRAAVMASIACDTMTRKLISPKDIFGRLDPARVAREIEAPLLAAVEDIAREVFAHYQPGLWEAMPEAVRRLVLERLKAESPTIVRQLMRDVQRDIDSVFDLKDMVVTNLLRDKALLNRVFQEAGEAEFRFIRDSGLPFGFAIGCVQALTWALTHNPWVMPLFGGFTGWFTDWLALKMVFEPKQPTRYCFGLVQWQGLFLKRRREIAVRYGQLIAREIVTPRNIIEAILKGPLSDRLFALVQRQAQRFIDEQAGRARPLLVFAVGGERYQAMKLAVAEKMFARLPDTLRHVEHYAGEAMDLERVIGERMALLSPEEFEALLRPAFQQDEWILITVGAVLGFLVGELQVLMMRSLAKPVVLEPAQAALGVLA
jgi:uncharacterized membrane protein YheB (UPF0754 family)